MDKYYNRIQKEFEEILLNLSKNPKTSFQDAYTEAKKYVNSFAVRKSLSQPDKDIILEYCIDLIQDWYPDIN